MMHITMNSEMICSIIERIYFYIYIYIIVRILVSTKNKCYIMFDTLIHDTKTLKIYDDVIHI